jgi:hypothetical protein
VVQAAGRTHLAFKICELILRISEDLSFSDLEQRYELGLMIGGASSGESSSAFQDMRIDPTATRIN